MPDEARVVFHVHERWDGGGYPDKLGGDDIPLESRIICAADALDWATRPSAHRKVRPLREALAEVFLRTSPDGYRELLHDHHAKSKQFRELEEVIRPSAA